MADIWVKACGMKTSADVAAAVDAGADAIGFVLAPSSRQVPAALVHRLADGVPVATYAVTVALAPDEVEPLVAATGVSGLQPHGAHAVEAATVADGLGLDVLFPVRVDGPVRPGEAGLGFRPLLDTATSVEGGSGRTFDWDLIEDDGAEFVLAGGLGPGNVAQAIAVARPWGVDASSGLESAPGRKDPDLIRAYVHAARSA